ncbi:hypothetical protein, partial [Falsigemmobacter intermedius]|uniref:hypothetical protein n=1 Tax=Falsigemmobacter intermedius TaxID=1553448 RepID=UPI0019D4206A
CSGEPPQPRTDQQILLRNLPFRHPSETSEENSPLWSWNKTADLNGMQTPDTKLQPRVIQKAASPQKPENSAFGRSNVGGRFKYNRAQVAAG